MRGSSAAAQGVPCRLALDPEHARAAALQTLTGEPGLRGQASANTGDVQVVVQRQVPTILLRLVRPRIPRRSSGAL